VPDISMEADGDTGMATGFTSNGTYRESTFGGTSLASPLLAGEIADAAQAQHTDRFGFLNGALYKTTNAVADVTARPLGVWTARMFAPGGAKVPTEPGDYLIDADSQPQSLKVGPGWDPVTGVGTPTAQFPTALGRS